MNELLRITANDLLFLRDEWDQSVSDDSLRRSSPVLRRLLVHNDLQRAWKAAGFEREPVIVTTDLLKNVDDVPMDTIVFASAGGALYNGVELQGALIAKGAPDANRKVGPPPPLEIGLRKFIESPSVIVNGHLIPRRLVVKYVANKMGGAHYDPKRTKSEEERQFVRLDRAAADVVILGKNAVYFELLSIGQALVASADVKKLYEAAR
jgi:hypothetical protein